MKKLIGLLLVLLLALPAAGMSWQGLTPSKSTYNDAVKILGKPYRTQSVDNQVDMHSFKTKSSGDGTAHVFVFKKNKKIVAIAFTPKTHLSRNDIHEAFNDPDQSIRDDDGTLVEFYGGPGLMINYAKDDQTVTLLLAFPAGMQGGKRVPG